MFEQYVDSKTTSSRRRRFVGGVVVFSAIAHAAVAVSLLVVAMWKIEKLALDSTPVTYGQPLGGSAAPPPLAGQKEEFEHKEIDKKVVDDDVQPDDTKEPTDETKSATVGHKDGTADGTGDTPGATGDGTGASPFKSPFCQDSVTCVDDMTKRTPPPPPKKKKKKVNHVTERELRARLRSGDTQIQPGTPVKAAMMRKRNNKLTSSFQTCVDASGRVTSVSIRKSTGYAAYDRKLIAGIKRWKFNPGERGGSAAATCAPINIMFLLQY